MSIIAGKPISIAQAEAARANGAKSRGPITEAGKAISSQNAVKHGLYSSICTLTVDEDKDQFNRHHFSHYQHFRPRNADEIHLVETIVICTWKIARSERFEAKILSARKPEGMSTADHQKSQLDQINIFESIRAKVEKRLRYARAELQKLQADPQFMTEAELMAGIRLPGDYEFSPEQYAHQMNAHQEEIQAAQEEEPEPLPAAKQTIQIKEILEKIAKSPILQIEEFKPTG